MATSLDGPEVVLLSLLFGPRSLCWAWVVVIIVCRVLELIIAAGADKDLLLVRLSVVAGITGETRSGRWWGLKVGFGSRLTAAKPTKTISLIIEFGRVARKRVGIHRKDRVVSDDLDVVARVGDMSNNSRNCREKTANIFNEIGSATSDSNKFYTASVVPLLLLLLGLLRNRSWKATVGRNIFAFSFFTNRAVTRKVDNGRCVT